TALLGNGRLVDPVGAVRAVQTETVIHEVRGDGVARIDGQGFQARVLLHERYHRDGVMSAGSYVDDVVHLRLGVELVQLSRGFQPIGDAIGPGAEIGEKRSPNDVSSQLRALSE